MTKKVETKAELESVISSGEAVIVKFGAEWCGPCRLLKPVLETYEGFDNIYDVDVEKADLKEALVALGVRSIPLTAFYKDGQLLDKKVGVYKSDELRDLIEKNFN